MFLCLCVCVWSLDLFFFKTFLLSRLRLCESSTHLLYCFTLIYDFSSLSVHVFRCVFDDMPQMRRKIFEKQKWSRSRAQCVLSTENKIVCSIDHIEIKYRIVHCCCDGIENPFVCRRWKWSIESNILFSLGKSGCVRTNAPVYNFCCSHSEITINWVCAKSECRVYLKCIPLASCFMFSLFFCRMKIETWLRDLHFALQTLLCPTVMHTLKFLFKFFVVFVYCVVYWFHEISFFLNFISLCSHIRHISERVSLVDERNSVGLS